MKDKKTKIRYSAMEKKAYYTGLGVGLTGQGPSSSELTRRAVDMMNKKEQASYIAGFERGQDNASILTGIRNNKKWFWYFKLKN